eukprot:CAMPEP_0171102238 /NCGR_PEP_ID=MMETSP0766_2-20121228/57246_1 /TAXON_ID=439317 /ORGANISM="Gambierdiscus australes, Strain CAWD 149" /LENGTH=192 /DNA_ID=CAMNT_0011562477 /DNA_START=70 /DNA_END=648 /DNA_ORIENTATION=-
MHSQQALPTLLTSRVPLLTDAKPPTEICLATQPMQRMPRTTALCVRNTFIDTAVERSPSLETFYREREVSTCPSSHIGLLRGLFKEPEEFHRDTVPASTPPPVVLSLVEAVLAPANPLPSSTQLPSVGSAGHGVGHCKPCAFFHTKGCKSEAACQFCHLCGPDEKKLRRKEKLEVRKAAQKLQRAAKLGGAH